jgi:hypothetical protein
MLCSCAVCLSFSLWLLELENTVSKVIGNVHPCLEDSNEPVYFLDKHGHFWNVQTMVPRSGPFESAYDELPLDWKCRAYRVGVGLCILSRWCFSCDRSVNFAHLYFFLVLNVFAESMCFRNASAAY